MPRALSAAMSVSQSRRAATSGKVGPDIVNISDGVARNGALQFRLSPSDRPRRARWSDASIRGADPVHRRVMARIVEVVGADQRDDAVAPRRAPEVAARIGHGIDAGRQIGADRLGQERRSGSGPSQSARGPRRGRDRAGRKRGEGAASRIIRTHGPAAMPATPAPPGQAMPIGRILPRRGVDSWQGDMPNLPLVSTRLG